MQEMPATKHNNMEKNSLVLQTLKTEKNALLFSFSLQLSEMYPEKAIMQTEHYAFDVDDFVRHGHATSTLRTDFHNAPQWNYWEERGTVYPTWEQSWNDVVWQENTLEVVRISYTKGYSNNTVSWIIADSWEVAHTFLLAVGAWNAEIRGEVLVFEGGCWQKNEELYASIQTSTFDNLVLPAELVEDIRADLSRFLSSQKLYEGYGIPWKRGVLLTGPPGNGKTHCIKALINWLEIPALYVKSLRGSHTDELSCIRSVFERARKVTPCLLILEDLDSLVNDKNRSFFLNELDGFAANTGIILIATTNHPERLDPAIVDRPSRFDRKYNFTLPEVPERAAYIRSWQPHLQEAMQLSEAGIAGVAEATEGFSFAYLKELLVSAIMRWVNDSAHGAMDHVMLEQCELLRNQMSSMNWMYAEVPFTPQPDDEYEM
jgi:hypothetical protein